LEDLVIELVHNPKDIKAIEQLIKKKNDDIITPKKIEDTSAATSPNIGALREPNQT